MAALFSIIDRWVFHRARRDTGISAGKVTPETPRVS